MIYLSSSKYIIIVEQTNETRNVLVLLVPLFTLGSSLLLGSTGIRPPPVLGSSSSVFDWTSQVLNDHRRGSCFLTLSHSPILPPPWHHPQYPWFHSPSIWQTRVCPPHRLPAQTVPCTHPAARSSLDVLTYNRLRKHISPLAARH